MKKSTSDQSVKPTTAPGEFLMHVRLTLIDKILGSSNANPEIHAEHIASKAETQAGGDEEVEAVKHATNKIVAAARKPAGMPGEHMADGEAETVEDVISKGTTVFPSDEIGIFAWDYQIRGFLKEAFSTQVDLGNPLVGEVSKWTYRKAVDSVLFVAPRRIYFRDPAGDIVNYVPPIYSRPIRVTTMQGERVALVSSQVLPAGVTLDIQMLLLESQNPKSKTGIKRAILPVLLNYGRLKGLGQWRSGSFGRITWKEIPAFDPLAPVTTGATISVGPSQVGSIVPLATASFS